MRYSRVDPHVPKMYSQTGFRTMSLTWLEADDDRLGMTRFEEGPAELVRRRTSKLTLETSLLVSILDYSKKALLRHTLAHELLHASGAIERKLCTMQ